MLAALLDLTEEWPVPLDQIGDRGGVIAVVVVGRRRIRPSMAGGCGWPSRTCDEGHGWAINAADVGLTRPVDPRTTSSVGKRTWRGRPAIEQLDDQLAGEAAAIANGWRTVVSGGMVSAAASMSSNPATETSSGTPSPMRLAAARAPIAS